MSPAYDQSTWLAKGSIEAEELGPPPVPQHFALPGAKMAVAHDRLAAYQANGHDERSIVDRTNQRFRELNGELLDAHDAWVAGPYHNAVLAMRQKEMDAIAEQRRRQALFEEMVAEREAADAGDG